MSPSEIISYILYILASILFLIVFAFNVKKYLDAKKMNDNDKSWKYALIFMIIGFVIFLFK